jgi:hypothetical protein
MPWVSIHMKGTDAYGRPPRIIDGSGAEFLAADGLSGLIPAPLPPQPCFDLPGTTCPAANGLVTRLVDLGVLDEMTGYARNRRFRYAPYIALFNDAGPGDDPAATAA